MCSSKPSRYFNQTLSSPRNQGSLENTSAERRALEEYVIWICDLTVGGQVVGSNCLVICWLLLLLLTMCLLSYIFYVYSKAWGNDPIWWVYFFQIGGSIASKGSVRDSWTMRNNLSLSEDYQVSLFSTQFGRAVEQSSVHLGLFDYLSSIEIMTRQHKDPHQPTSQPQAEKIRVDFIRLRHHRSHCWSLSWWVADECRLVWRINVPSIVSLSVWSDLKSMKP